MLELSSPICIAEGEFSSMIIANCFVGYYFDIFIGEFYPTIICYCCSSIILINPAPTPGLEDFSCLFLISSKNPLMLKSTVAGF
jgi:hypothetical protein